MNKLLTVIVPVYKVEKYINKCLDSLILPEQQMNKLEVIVVNDGSPDNSAIMAKEYEIRFPEVFKVIDKENGGHGSAWNKGVELASGKYLRFLDSDDWLDNHNLLFLLDYLSNSDVDLIFTHRNRHYENSGKDFIDRIDSVEYGKVYNIDEKSPLEGGMPTMTNFWYCTYRTSIIKTVSPLFIEKIMFDDGILFIAPILLSNTYSCLDIVLYNYLLGRVGQSMSKETEYKHLDHRLRVQKSMIDFANSHPASSKNKNDFVTNALRNNIHGFSSEICFLPYGERTKMMKEWYEYVNANARQYVRGTALQQYSSLPNILFELYVFFLQLKKALKKIIKRNI